MNIFLWVVQGLLAAHTLIGAVWKFKTTAEQTMPSLKAIPPTIWMGIGGIEILFAIGLLLPAIYKPAAAFVPLWALGIGAVMIAYCILHLASGARETGPMIYWLVVLAVCVGVAYGRTKI